MNTLFVLQGKRDGRWCEHETDVTPRLYGVLIQHQFLLELFIGVNSKLREQTSNWPRHTRLQTKLRIFVFLLHLVYALMNPYLFYKEWCRVYEIGRIPLLSGVLIQHQPLLEFLIGITTDLEHRIFKLAATYIR